MTKKIAATETFPGMSLADLRDMYFARAKQYRAHGYRDLALDEFRIYKQLRDRIATLIAAINI